MKGYLDRLEGILRAVPSVGVIRWTWTGSRTIDALAEDGPLWRMAIVSQLQLAMDVVPNARGRIVISHGGARGADRLVDDTVEQLFGFRRRPYRVTDAEWARYGGWAGHQRNARMLETEAPHLLSALIKRRSRGTVGCRDNALARGIPVVQVDDEGLLLPRVRAML